MDGPRGYFGTQGDASFNMFRSTKATRAAALGNSSSNLLMGDTKTWNVEWWNSGITE